MNEKEKQQNNDEKRKSGMAYAAAFSLFLTVAICLGIGWLLDRWLGKSPLFLVIGIIVGSALGLYEFVKITKKISD